MTLFFHSANIVTAVVLTAAHSNCKYLDLHVILTDGQLIKDYLLYFTGSRM